MPARPTNASVKQMRPPITSVERSAGGSKMKTDLAIQRISVIMFLDDREFRQGIDG